MVENELYNLDAYFSISSALANLTTSFYGLERLIVALSYIIGLSLVVRGVMMYRIFANQTYGSAQRGEIAGPMVFLVVGTILIYFPTTMHSSMNTMFGTTEMGTMGDLAPYLKNSSQNTIYFLENVVVKYFKLIGLIAFLRGWIILSKMGHPGAQPGSVGKGIIHVVGGVILINIIGMIHVLAYSFGIQA